MGEIILMDGAGKEIHWSEYSRKKVIGDFVLVAELEAPGRGAILQRFELGRIAHWAFPGGGDEAMLEAGRILDALDTQAILTQEQCRLLQERAFMATDAGAFREIIGIAIEKGYWIRTLESSDMLLRAGDPAEFDPWRHGLVWLHPAEIEMKRAFRGHGGDHFLRKILEALNRQAVGDSARFSVFAARARCIGPSTWETGDFWRLAGGLDEGAAELILSCIKERKIREREPQA